MASATYQRPWMYEAQRDAFFGDSRYSIIEASSKAGKTVGAMAWLFEQGLFGEDGHNFWWTAPILPQSRIAFRRMKRGLPGWIYDTNESELTITLANGAVIWFKSGDNPDSLYGEDVYAAVIDEASRVKAESWYAIRSTLTATRGPIRLIGNVKGRKNFFYQLARRAQAGEPGYEYHKITAYDAVAAGVLDAEEIEDARRTLPERVFQELYLAEPSDDEGNPFGAQHIRACIHPISTKPATYFGVDLAKSVDWTVIVGLDGDGRVCHFDRFQAPWEETESRVMAAVGSTPAYVDSTGVGDPIVERMSRKSQNIEGYKFTAPSKQMLMEGLSVAIQQQEIAFPEGPISSELLNFEYEYRRSGNVRYSAPKGFHDDCVMALALAASKRNAMPMVAPASYDMATSSGSYSTNGPVF